MGAQDNRAAAVAAFKGIQRSPRVRQHFGRTRSAHHTHTTAVLKPHLLQRQENGGVWVGLTRKKGLRCALRIEQML
jgi:hypothetical protein